LLGRHDAELLAGIVDYADFANPDAFIGANAVITSGRTVESDGNLPGPI